MKGESVQDVIARIRASERWQSNLAFGEPRPGHPEGTIGAHVAEVLCNIDVLAAELRPGEHERLEVLALVHDSFKGEATPKVPIEHPQSHSSIAAAFLAECTDDADLIEMVRRHDEPYALHRRVASGKPVDQKRLDALLDAIKDLRLFALFQVCDNVTAGKDHTSVVWWLELMKGRGVDVLFRWVVTGGQNLRQS